MIPSERRARGGHLQAFDTGVFIRWFLDQNGLEDARELRGRLAYGTATAATVDFARGEVAGVLRKKALLTGRFTVAFP